MPVPFAAHGPRSISVPEPSAGGTAHRSAAATDNATTRRASVQELTIASFRVLRSNDDVTVMLEGEA